MKIGLAGDWHGNTVCARYTISLCGVMGIHSLFQLGDFGLGFKTVPGAWERYLDEVKTACVKHGVRLFVVPGNHENYDWMERELGWDKSPYDLLTVPNSDNTLHVMRRGCRFELGGRTILGLGGAPSIDFPHRVPRLSWWPQEMIRQEEVEKIVAEGHADIMLAHDAPDGGTERVQRIIDTPWEGSMWTDRGLRYAREGRMLMNEAVVGVRPKVFAHGHYHVADERQTDETKFLSLACDGMMRNFVTLDLETLDHAWIA